MKYKNQGHTAQGVRLPTPVAFQRNFATALRSERIAKKLTMRELAELAGVDPEAGRNRISRIERGKCSVSLYTALCLAHALGISVDRLCFRARAAPNLAG